MSAQVPQIDSDSESIAPDYPTYRLEDGTYVRVAAPTELGLRQIQMLIKTSRRIQPALNVLTNLAGENDEDEEVSEEEFEEALNAARQIVAMTSDMDSERIENLPELELIGYVTGFLGELTNTIGASTRLRFR